MDMKQLEAFACVAEQRSFSKAARLLHLTQPTVSARVASLEQELQIQLLQRPSAIPSEAGELLYHYAGQMLALRTQALDALQGFSREMRGTVSVAASTVPGQYFLPRLLHAFRELYPDISFDIHLVDSAEAVAQVVSRSAEIGFTGTLPESSKRH